MSYSGLRRNITWNLIEVVLTGLGMFVLFKIIIRDIGLASLGVWSLVLSTTSLARIVDLGASTGLGRYVAISQAKGEAGEKALIYTETAIITNLIFYSSVCGLIYFPCYAALGLATKGAATVQARDLLPLSLISLVFSSIGGVIGSALMGFHCSYQKSMINTVGVFLQIFCALALVHKLGLQGLGIAQVSQALVICVGGWLMVVRRCRGGFNIIMPYRIGLEPLRELLGFGARLQALSLAAFAYEPLTKFILSTFGGLAALGLFEMANRLVQQLRQIIVAPSMNLTPIFTTANEKDPETLPSIYGNAVVNISSIATAANVGLIIIGPFISWVWLGRIDISFVSFVSCLSVGWLVNIYMVPAYLMGVGLGRVRWNVFGALLTSFLSPALSLILVKVLGPIGVVFSAAFAVLAGAALTGILNCRDFNVPLIPNGKLFRDWWVGKFRYALIWRKTRRLPWT